MRHRWEELTSIDFPRAVEQSERVCVVPVGVLEKHGDHLPVGTDSMVIEALADCAAEIEYAVVFPAYHFGQIHEGKHWPGAIAIRRPLLFELLANVCEEIARNGFTKIVLLNGHGGNETFLKEFSMSMLEKPHDFTVYVIRLEDYFSDALNSPEWQSMAESSFDHHGGDVETSVVLAVRPDLVKMDEVASPGTAQGRLSHLPHALTSMFWYKDYPDHYAGDARPATPAKGEFLCRRYAGSIAEILKSIKADTETKRLEDEFFSRVDHHRR